MHRDRARCHDSHCPEREQCLRWLLRSSGTNHVASGRPAGWLITEPCPIRVPTNE